MAMPMFMFDPPPTVPMITASGRDFLSTTWNPSCINSIDRLSRNSPTRSFPPPIGFIIPACWEFSGALNARVTLLIWPNWPAVTPGPGAAFTSSMTFFDFSIPPPRP
jgi:hypothetical protein